jgi:SulP family sulfate permease
MITTVVITIFTHNLAIGVLVGIVLSTVFFSRQIAQVVFVDSVLSEDGNQRTYSVAGQLFFISVDEFISAFDFKEELEQVTLNLSNAHLWDQAAVAAIDKVVLKFRRTGAEVELVGLNKASETLLQNLAVYNQEDALNKIADH